MDTTCSYTRFIFENAVAAEDIRDTLGVALAAVRGTRGEAAVELQARHEFDADNHEVRIATGAPAGRDLALALHELASASLGRESFTIISTWGAL